MVTLLIPEQTAEKYPVMAKFEYNWATAEMVKLYLRNSRAQFKRKARKAGGSGPETPVGPGLTGADTNTGTDMGSASTMANLGDDSGSDSEDSDED